MRLQDLKKFNLPDAPGVYLFKCLGKIVYIGKAASLKSRVRSYFADLLASRGMLLVDMITKADGIQYFETPSVLEALILEANLIKKHQPFYNSREKDDKSYNCVVITKEAFPQILIIRQKDLAFNLKPKNYQLQTSFGPFPHGRELQEAMKIVRKIFPWRGRKCSPNQGKPCFERQIGLCPGVCTGEIPRKDYAKTIRHVKLFFQGKKKRLLKILTMEMKECAKREDFENAGKIKRAMFAIRHIQDVALMKKSPDLSIKDKPFRLEAFDIAHISDTNVVGAMAVVENDVPQKSDYRKFIIQTKLKGDVASLKEVISRRLMHKEWPLPDLIVFDGGQAQENAVKKILKDNGLTNKIKVAGVLKDERHKPKMILGNAEHALLHKRAILLANSEAHRFAVAFHKKRRDRIKRDRIN